jgi:hypothetical protein
MKNMEKNILSTKDMESEINRHSLIKDLEQQFLNLDNGFIVANSDFKINFRGNIYHFDLLMLNVNLNRYIIVELLDNNKVTENDISLMNFYVNFTNRSVRKIYQKNCIGIFVKKDKNKFKVIYKTNNDIDEVLPNEF